MQYRYEIPKHEVARVFVKNQLTCFPLQGDKVTLVNINSFHHVHKMFKVWHNFAKAIQHDVKVTVNIEQKDEWLTYHTGENQYKKTH